MITYRIKILANILLISVILISCSSHYNDREAVSSSKQQLIIAIGTEPEDGFDPTVGWGSYGSPLFQSTLLKRDRSLHIVNDLATEVAVSEDGRVWTINIRKDVIFSDGTPLTASDVQFTFETAKQSASIVDLSNLAEVEAVNSHQIVFTLQQPQSTFRSQLATIGIVPEHAYDDNYGQHPLGSGPFKFVQWDKGQQVIMEANPHYYGDKPYFHKVTLVFLHDDAAFAAARSGQVDLTYISPLFSERIPDGMKLVRLPSVDNRGIMFPFVAAGDETSSGKPIGNDVTVHTSIRKAINIAIDRQALVDGLFAGFAMPAYSSHDHLPWWNEETVFADGRVEEAASILRADGWVDTEGDGVLVKDGIRASFDLLYPAGDVTRQSLAFAVAEMLKPVGLEVKPLGKSWPEIERLMHSQPVLLGFGSHDPLEMYHLYNSKFKGIAFNNPGYYSNSQVDRWLERAMTSADEEEAWTYWQRAQWDGTTGFAYAGDAPWAWLVNIDHLYLVPESLNIGTPKIQPHGHGWPLLDNIAEWHWEE